MAADAPLFTSVDCVVAEEGVGSIAAQCKAARVSVVMVAHTERSFRALAMEHLCLRMKELSVDKALIRAIVAASQSTRALRGDVEQEPDDETVRRSVPAELMIESISLGETDNVTPMDPILGNRTQPDTPLSAIIHSELPKTQGAKPSALEAPRARSGSVPPAPAAFRAYSAYSRRQRFALPGPSAWWLLLASLALIALGYMLAPVLS